MATWRYGDNFLDFLPKVNSTRRPLRLTVTHPSDVSTAKRETEYKKLWSESPSRTTWRAEANDKAPRTGSSNFPLLDSGRVDQSEQVEAS